MLRPLTIPIVSGRDDPGRATDSAAGWSASRAAARTASANWCPWPRPNSGLTNDEIAELDRRDVGQVVVPLRGIVVQPADCVVHAPRLDDDCRLAPHHIDAPDRGTELLAERIHGRVRIAAPMRDILRRHGRRRAGAERASRDARGEATVVVHFGHKPERV